MPVSKLTLKARERGESEAWQKTRLATLGSGSEILSLFSGVKRERNIPYLILYWRVIYTEFLQMSERDKICDTNTLGLSDSYYLGRGNAAVCRRPGLLIISFPVVELSIIKDRSDRSIQSAFPFIQIFSSWLEARVIFSCLCSSLHTCSEKQLLCFPSVTQPCSVCFFEALVRILISPGR